MRKKMLFNLDRNLKHSILEEYKKEALLYEQRRQQEKQQKIKEEQEYLDKINKKEKKKMTIIKYVKVYSISKKEFLKNYPKKILIYSTNLKIKVLPKMAKRTKRQR